MSKPIILSVEQQAAHDVLVDFAMNTPEKESDYFATLSGFAGTGKSTVMKDIIDKLQRSKKKIVVSAPTHKAKEIIGKITNQPAETIQSLLGLRPNIDLTDFDPHKPIFDVRAEQRIQFYNVLVIDEASMLGKEAIKLIEDTAIQHKVKVIYVGDEYQLPPVNEKGSVVFENNRNIVRLTEIRRQSNTNPNQKLIEIARNDVRDGTDHFIKYLMDINKDMNGEEGFNLLPKNDYYPALLEKFFDSEYQQNPDIVKALAWTNKAVGAINAWLRERIIKSEEMLAIGDVLMGYKPISKEIDYPPYFIPIIKNSVDYIITGLKIEEKLFMGVALKGFIVEVKDGVIPMFILHRDSYKDFIIAYNERLKKGKDFNNWKPYYTFKNQIALLEDVYDEFRNKVCVKDIDYGYAITVHKSQGSTYNNVGISLSDIMRCRQPQDRRRLIYVAISRTSKENLFNNG